MESHLSWYVKKVSDQKKKSDKDQCMLGAHAVTSGNSSESNLKKVGGREVCYMISGRKQETFNIVRF